VEYVAVLLPSVCLAVLFYFVIKAIFNADRAEREAMAKAEELQDAEDARNRAAADEKNGNPEIDPR
jgi:hypothetical protein